MVDSSPFETRPPGSCLCDSKAFFPPLGPVVLSGFLSIEELEKGSKMFHRNPAGITCAVFHLRKFDGRGVT